MDVIRCEARIKRAFQSGRRNVSKTIELSQTVRGMLVQGLNVAGKGYDFSYMNLILCANLIGFLLMIVLVGF